MGCLTTISVVILVVSVLIGYFIYSLTIVPDLPQLEETYWGPAPERPDDTTVKPFKIAIPDQDLFALNEKLNQTRTFTKPLAGVAFEYGFNTDYLTRLVDYWKAKYNWRQREKYLNSLPQYTTQIAGLQIHFVWAKPDPTATKGKKLVPILLLHGWPGSFVEFYKLIPLLTSPRPDSDIIFQVVAPSLPGYGFSQGSSRPGLGPAQMGVIFNRLMKRLGHDKYFVQGGDWGSMIGTTMSILFPERVLGFHSNFCSSGSVQARYRMLLAYFFPSFFMDENKHEQYQNQFSNFIFLEAGYFHLQATKPDTIGVALTDSPVGLAAYILEKFSTWTNQSYRGFTDGGLQRKFNKDELLDNVMIYWFTKSITTSMRLYSEAMSRNNRNLQFDAQPVLVPVACLQMPNELLFYPRSVLEATYHNLVSLTEAVRGGHFAAFEEPALVAEDIWTFLNTITKTKTKQFKS